MSELENIKQELTRAQRIIGYVAEYLVGASHALELTERSQTAQMVSRLLTLQGATGFIADSERGKKNEQMDSVHQKIAERKWQLLGYSETS